MAKKSLRKGIFITFEGVEGCGKTTHSKLIYKYLLKMGYPCIYTREPGGTKVGNKIRNILLDPKNSINPIAELFLFEASRSQIVAEIIKPALLKKKIVICDRFFDATLAYQGYGLGLKKSDIMYMSRLATGGLKPHLTIILDVGIKEGLCRATRRKTDRVEGMGLVFHNRVRKGYREIARKEPKRVKIISTRCNLKEAHKLVRKVVLDVIQRYKITR